MRKEAVSRFGSKPISSTSLSQNLHDILKKAQYNKKSVFSDSESSDTEKRVPKFDCSGGLRLSDGSDDSESENNEKAAKIRATQKKTSDLVNSINEESERPTMDLWAIHDNLEKMKHAREKLSKYSAPDTSADNTNSNNDNVADLLSMGENAKKIAASQKRKKASQGDDSDSDNWQEVEGKRKIPRYVRLLKKFEYDE